MPDDPSWIDEVTAPQEHRYDPSYYVEGRVSLLASWLRRPFRQRGGGWSLLVAGLLIALASVVSDDSRRAKVAFLSVSGVLAAAGVAVLWRKRARSGPREAVEFHDSVLGRIEVQSGHAIIDLSPAYIHRDDGTGWVANMRITIGDARGDLPAIAFPARIWDGRLRVGATDYDNVVALPLESVDRVELHLTLNAGEEVELSGRGVVVRVVGSYKLVEGV
jgi:hypothetical protein